MNASPRAQLPGDLPPRFRPARSGLSYWANRPDGLLLFAFACGTMFLTGFGQLRALGIAMIASFPVVHSLRLDTALNRLWPAPPELSCYSLWGLWAGATGIFVAADPSLYFGSLRLLAQMFVMIWGSYAILRNLKSENVIYVAVLIGGLVQIVALVSGATTVRDILNADRATALTINPNHLGNRMIWCVMGALMLWRAPGRARALRRVSTLALITAAAYVLSASGSRKAAVGMAFLIVGWIGYALAHENTRRDLMRRGGAAVIALLIGVTALLPLMKGTPVGDRFAAFSSLGQGSLTLAAKQNVRFMMYVEGFKYFWKNPIFGIGLNNFQHYFFTGQYSHSDYMEPLATTGLIGFFLYQSFYVFLLVRTFRLMRVEKEVRRLYELKMIVLCILTIMIIGLGTPHYASQTTFILLVSFSAATWRRREEMRLNARLEEAKSRRSNTSLDSTSGERETPGSPPCNPS